MIYAACYLIVGVACAIYWRAVDGPAPLSVTAQEIAFWPVGVLDDVLGLRFGGEDEAR